MNATEDKTYNGWKNYETWCVNLWLGNEQETYSAAREMASEARAEAADPELRNKYWTEEELAKFTLTDNLNREFEEGNPLEYQASVWHDLLAAALSEVDWQEIAENILSE